jgi:hypothetical protein
MGTNLRDVHGASVSIGMKRRADDRLQVTMRNPLYRSGVDNWKELYSTLTISREDAGALAKELQLFADDVEVEEYDRFNDGPQYELQINTSSGVIVYDEEEM